MHFSRRIAQGVKWNAFESIAYQLLLCVHRFMVYKVAGGVLFGTIGALFSCVYGSVFLAQLGFNESINAFFKEFSVSRATARRFFLHHGVMQGILLVGAPCIVFIVPFPVLSLISQTAFYAAAFLFIVESIRIALRTLLQLTFLNKELALIDFVGLCLYVSTIWIYWFCGYALTVESLLIPLVIVSCLQLPFLVWYAVRWYRNLPTSHVPPLSNTRILRVRFFSWLHHIASSHSISNALIPYTAYAWGLEYASLAKLLSTLVQMVTTVLRHTIGFSSLALFTQYKHAPAKDKRPLFYRMNKILFITLLCISMSTLVISTLLTPFFPLPVTFISIFILFLTLEACFIPCEAAYLIQERTDILAVTFLINIAALSLFSFMYTPATSTMLFLVFIGIRSITVGFLTVFLPYRWK